MALLKIREEKSKKQFNSDHTMFEDKNIIRIEEKQFNSNRPMQCLRAIVGVGGQFVDHWYDHYHTCKRHFCVGDCFSALDAFCYL